MSQANNDRGIDQDVVSRMPSFVSPAELRRSSSSSRKSDASQESFPSPRDGSPAISRSASVRSLKNLETLGFEDPLVSSLMDTHVGRSPNSSSRGVRKLDSVRSFSKLETLGGEDTLVSAIMDLHSGGIRERLHLPVPKESV